MSSDGTDAGWPTLAAFPSENYGQVTIDTLLRWALMMGYSPDEIDVGCAFVDDRLMIAVGVHKDTYAVPPEISVRWEDMRLERPLAIREEEAGEAEPGPEPAPAVPARTPSPAYDPITCPECGRVCRGNTGLSAHRRAQHPEAPAVPPPPTEPGPKLAVPSVPSIPRPYWRKGEPMLVCADCDNWFSNTTVTLAIHTQNDHQRTPSSEEVTPVGSEETARRWADHRGAAL